MAALQAEVQASQAWNRATAAVWADLRRGISLVHAIIEAMVQRLLDTVEEFPGVAEALNAIQRVPGEAPLVAALTGVPGDLDDAAVFLGQQWSDLEWGRHAAEEPAERGRPARRWRCGWESSRRSRATCRAW